MFHPPVSDSLIGILMAILLVSIFLHFTNWLEKRKSEKHAKVDALREQEHEARELKQKRDHQLNHGRQVYNWLTKQLSPYTKFGIEVRKLEDNGGGFTIEVIRRHEEAMRGFDSLVQLTFDYVRYAKPYQGHIHYGSHGGDQLCYVSDHAPFAGLEHFVIRDVLLEVERLTKREAAMA